MAMFDYRDYSAAESAALIDLTHQLAVASAGRSLMGLDGNFLAGAFEWLTGQGTLSGSPIDVKMPAGWEYINEATLGLSGVTDAEGYLRLVSPMTGTLHGGPQLMVSQQKDAAGNITGLAIAWTATNSPVDLPDYFRLNDGGLVSAMSPVLDAVATYAKGLGLTGKDVLVTGYSLGGGMTNIQSANSDKIAGGFFADSNYIGHASPVIDNTPGRVLNVGYENDVVHRATGDAKSFIDAITQADPLLSNADGNFESSTDNIVIYDRAYDAGNLLLAIDSILNPFSWWGHIGGALSDATARIGKSAFYDLTSQDSVVVVSNLGADMRGTTWVRDKASPTSDHFGAPAFVIGTQYDDKLADGRGNDFIDGGLGDDTIRVSTGYDRVEGGGGTDTLRLTGPAGDYSVSRLADGSLAFVSANGLAVATGIEKVEFTKPGLLGLFDSTVPYSIQSDRLEDEHWSLFEWGDKDVPMTQATSGTASADTLTGTRVFGLAGDDKLSGTAGNDLLVGGRGRDVLDGKAGDDRLYGAEDDDRLIGSSGNDTMNGGHGNDVFVFTKGLRGTTVIEDFNQAANESDVLSVQGLFSNTADLLASSRQSGTDVVISAGDLTIRLAHVTLGDLQEGQFIF